MNIRFNQWLDTFVQEKGLDLEWMFTPEGKTYGTNYIPLGCVIDAIKSASPDEQAAIKRKIVELDFRNANVMHFFGHLAKALAI